MITEDIGNSTVALGREASLKCVVTHLSDYKVKMIMLIMVMMMKKRECVATHLSNSKVKTAKCLRLLV